MKVDNPNAFRFIMPDDIYLLDKDKGLNNTPSAETIPETEPPAPAAPIVETPISTFNYMGENNKRFLVLVNYASEEFIAAAHLAALENVLKRKELAVSDVAILNTYNYAGVSMEQLQVYFSPQKLLILGAGAIPAGMDEMVLNQPLQLAGCAALYSYSFDEMMESNDNKKAFWEQMKKI